MTSSPVHADGDLLIPLVDVLAAVRLGVDADLLLVEFVDGAQRAMRLTEVFDLDVFVRLVAVHDSGTGPEWRVRLWSEDSGSSADVVSIRATTFASFVGLS